ncbi:MAG: alpha/beta hydrolase [Candidatus Thorarchaeota archaeon]|jgi:putative redox protein
MVEIKVIPTEFSVEGEMIRGNFVVPKGEGPFPGICKYHGIPGGSDQVSGVATELAQAGFAVLTFNFRGFRDSDGIFTLSGEIEDTKASVTHLIDSDLTIDSWVGVVASSYGAAVAVCSAASDTRVDAVAIRAPVYDTLWFAKSPMIRPAVDQIRATDPSQIRGIEDPETVEYVLNRMIEDAKIHNPMNEISKISPRPLLIIHGTDDVGIDLAGVKRLYELAGEPKDLVVVEGADHVLSNPVAYEVTMKTVVDWYTKQWNER